MTENTKPGSNDSDISPLPPFVTDPPNPLCQGVAPKPSNLPQVLSVLLSLCLGLFLADAVVSLADDTLNLIFGVHPLTILRGIVFVLASLLAIAVYGLMGLTPMIPKRLFLPITLFCLAGQLIALPGMIYFYNRLPLIVWIISVGQVVVGLGILFYAQGGLKLRWPLVAESWLGTKRFGWLNLTAFVLLNVFVLLPAVLVYLVFCTGLAVGHFTDGFLALRPDGLTVQVRKYLRDDGKTIELVPMAHVGDATFYQKLTSSFPSNSIILMEGVTDDKHLLTNQISYKRMAKSLGLTEQREEFKPSENQVVRADVDVAEFTPDTLALLNLVMRIHAQGLNPDNVRALIQYSPPPKLEFQLFDDLLTKRNQHLLAQIHDQLLQSENLIVPWGAAHMPGIAQGIQSAGFRLQATQEFKVIRLGGK